MAKPIGEILQELADMDVFFYVLPFLLIFALVFAILQKIRLMGGEVEDNKGVSAVIAASVALLSLQFDMVPIFFQTIFPKLGIGLSVILVIVIFVGLFVDFKKYEGPTSIFFVVAGVIAAIVILSSLNDYSWWSGGFWQDNMSAIVAGIIVIGFIALVITSGTKKPGERRFWQDLGNVATRS